MVVVIQVCWQLARSQAVIKPVWHTPLLCVQWKTPDDGQRNCPKHVEFYSKTKFEKLVHLVGFVTRWFIGLVWRWKQWAQEKLSNSFPEYRTKTWYSRSESILHKCCDAKALWNGSNRTPLHIRRHQSGSEYWNVCCRSITILFFYPYVKWDDNNTKKLNFLYWCVWEWNLVSRPPHAEGQFSRQLSYSTSTL